MAATSSSPAKMPFFTSARFVGLFDRLLGARQRDVFRRWVVYLAVSGFAIHLLLVFLSRMTSQGTPLLAAVGTNYLAALYTPFSFILFYEVLLLILSIPESTTRSLGKQYEILSLIVIRNVFKDIAEFESVTELTDQIEEFAAVLLDMGGGLVMFLLVALFYHVNGHRPRLVDKDPLHREKVQAFVARKKGIALALIALLFGLAGVSLVRWGMEVFGVVRLGGVPTIDVRTIFYIDVFTVMIFADALILLLSLLLFSRYELVFRNAAFVVATILLRFSLAVQKPYDVELGIVSMAYGVLVLLIYNYYLRKSVIGPASGG